MAILRKQGTDIQHHVRSRLLVGRASSSGLRLQASGVSSEHAAIQWSGADWMIRDLGSRNGTRVNDKLLLRTSLRLVPGDRITFGDPQEQWTWLDGAPPMLAAVRSDGTEIRGGAGMLLLPNEQNPVAALLVRGDRWQLELAGSTREVRDQDRIEVAGDSFLLLLPDLDAPEARTQTIVPTHLLVHARLRFRVSLDEEHVQITVESQQVRRELSQRSFSYMLLLLARQRLQDQRATVPEPDSGWLYVDDLAKQLGAEVNALNVHVHRARRMLAPNESDPPGLLSFEDAHELIQRREGQLRLGVPDVSVERSDGSIGEGRTGSAE